MTPICSVLIPSRSRPDGLIRAIKSVLETVHDPDSIEILIGLDDDDLESYKRLKEIESQPQVKVFIWPRAWLKMIADLANLAVGRWIVILNDDATIEGQGWDTQLEAAPLTGVVFQPEIYRLNESRYPYATRTGFPWFPNKCWEVFGCSNNFLPHPCDYEVCNLAEDRGWKIQFLKGITVYHDRKEPTAAAPA